MGGARNAAALFESTPAQVGTVVIAAIRCRRPHHVRVAATTIVSPAATGGVGAYLCAVTAAGVTESQAVITLVFVNSVNVA